MQEDAQSWGLFGSVAFSLALAMAMIGGARELLRPRMPVLILAGIAALVVLAVSTFSPVLARVVALLDLAIVALAHAASSTLVRVDPTPRFRIFLLAVVLAGTLGALIAIIAPLPWAFVLSEL
jgi:hypothetical protein